MTEVGTTGNDILYGTSSDDILYGLQGNDTLYGYDGNDLLDGGPGDDSMIGGLGNDTYVIRDFGDVVVENPGEGNDWAQISINAATTPFDVSLTGMLANVENLMLSGQYAFTGSGNASDNQIIGTGWSNLLEGFGGNDTLVGTGGNNSLMGGDGDDSLFGGPGNDSIMGEAGNDTLVGGAGNDWLDGGTGADSMVGGSGNDTYIADNVGDVVSEEANQGFDVIYSSVDFSTFPNFEALVLTGATGLENLNGTGTTFQNDSLVGNDGDNILDGLSGNDTLLGMGGNDTLLGGAGDDSLVGGTGLNSLVGGLGNDTYVVSQATDVIFENPDEGEDWVQASTSYTLPANVNNLQLTGVASLAGQWCSEGAENRGRPTAHAASIRAPLPLLQRVWPHRMHGYQHGGCLSGSWLRRNRKFDPCWRRDSRERQQQGQCHHRQ